VHHIIFDGYIRAEKIPAKTMANKKLRIVEIKIAEINNTINT